MDKRQQLRRWALFAVSLPLSAHAFIDERTKVSAPASQEQKVQETPAVTRPANPPMKQVEPTSPHLPLSYSVTEPEPAPTAAPTPSSNPVSIESTSVTTVEVAPAEPDPVPVKTVPAWSLKEGRMLSDELERYAKESGIKVIWEAKVDYKIMVGFSMNKASPIENITAVLALYDPSVMPFAYTWYAKQNLLLIQDKTTY